MNSKNNDIADPWGYFNIPSADLAVIQREYGWMMGAGRHRLIANNERKFVIRLLHSTEVQSENNPYTWDLHDNYAYSLARLSIIASFLSQYYQNVNLTFKIRLLPETVKKYFCYPYSETREYNRDSLIKWKATLPPAYQNEVFINV